MSTQEEQKEIYPPFLLKEFEKSRENRKNRPQFITKNEDLPPPPTKITDFLQLIRTTWVISNKEYQDRFWVRQELPLRGDNYMETMETFLHDGRAVLDTSDYAVEMTDKQRKMLQKLYDMAEGFEDDDSSADDPGYGVNDPEIVVDPKWDKVRQYAKLVYEEISGDKLASGE